MVPPQTATNDPDSMAQQEVDSLHQESALHNTDTNNTNSTSCPVAPPPSAPPQLPIPVDRNWILKLLQKYPNPSSRLQDKALVIAPMVDQSDLPFRLLGRKYGANLAFTPMVHCKLLNTSEAYRDKFLGTFLPTLDRPLIAQVCGCEPESVLEAIRYLEPHVDGIDLNCGCPQNIAKRGNYGAFLLEQEETLLTLIKYLVQHLTIPLSVKVRLVPTTSTTGHDDDDDDHNDMEANEEKKMDEEGENYESAYDDDNDDDDDDNNENATTGHSSNDIGTCPSNNNISNNNRDCIAQASLELYGKLIDAGIHLLTIHGRTRFQKGLLIEPADWKTIRRAVDLYGHRIPIFANGSIESFDDVIECLKITHADGVMSSEAVLEYPPIFYKHEGHGPIDTSQYCNTNMNTNTNNDNTRLDQEEELDSWSPPRLIAPSTIPRTIGRLQIAQEYLQLARQYPPQLGGQGSGLKCIRMHTHRFLNEDLQHNPKIRTKLIFVETVEEIQVLVDQIEKLQSEQGHDVATETLSWYWRHRADPIAVQERIAREGHVKCTEISDDAAECFSSLFGEEEEES